MAAQSDDIQALLQLIMSLAKKQGGGGQAGTGPRHFDPSMMQMNVSPQDLLLGKSAPALGDAGKLLGDLDNSSSASSMFDFADPGTLSTPTTQQMSSSLPKWLNPKDIAQVSTQQGVSPASISTISKLLSKMPHLLGGGLEGLAALASFF